MSPKGAQRWKRIKAEGLVRFVVFRGGLWTLLFVALFTLFMAMNGDWQRFASGITAKPLQMIAALVLVGIAWALFVWFWEDIAYRRYVAKNGVPPDHAA